MAADSDVLTLNHTLLVYLCTTTMGLKAREGTPVLITGTQRSNVGPTKYISSAPTLQMAVDLAGALAEQTAEVARDYASLVERSEGGVALLSEKDVEGLESGVLPLEEVSVEDAAVRLVARSRLLHSESKVDVSCADYRHGRVGAAVALAAFALLRQRGARNGAGAAERPVIFAGFQCGRAGGWIAFGCGTGAGAGAGGGLAQGYFGSDRGRRGECAGRARAVRGARGASRARAARDAGSS